VECETRGGTDNHRRGRKDKNKNTAEHYQAVTKDGHPGKGIHIETTYERGI